MEQFVFDNLDKFFSNDRIFIEKKRITTKLGKYGYPDGILLDISSSELCIIENETKFHSLYDHIIPQIMRYIIASRSKKTRKVLRDLFIEEILKNKDNYLTKFRKNYPKLEEIEIFKQIEEILSEKPNIFIFIDEISHDLKEFCLIVKDHLNIKAVKVIKVIDNDKPIYFFDDDEYSFTRMESSIIKEKKASEKYNDIFENLLGELKSKRPEITSRGPSKSNVCQIGFGIRGFHLEWYILGREPNKVLQTAIHFEKSNPDINHAVFDYLLPFEKELVQQLGEEITFKKDWLNDGNWSSLHVERSVGTFQTILETNSIKIWAVESLIILYDFIQLHMEEMRKIIENF